MEVIQGKEDANPRKKRKIQSMDSWSGERNGHDLISLLPDDCLSHIFSFLSSTRDRCSSAAVSRRWLFLQACLVPFVSGGQDGEVAVPPRRFLCRRARDFRLAAMAVGSTRSRFPSEIHIQSFSLRSSLSMGVSDLGLSFVSFSGNHLKTLSIWNCALVSDRGLMSVARFCPGLRKLDVSNLPKISDDSLVAIAKSCKKLFEVRVETCPLVGDGALRAFSEYSMELKIMSVKDCSLVGTSGSVSVSASLSKLSLTGVSLTDQALADLSQRASKLESLDLEKCHEVTSAGLMAALRNLSPSLRSISLVKCNELGKALVEGKDSSGEVCPSLSSVTVNGCPSVCDEFLYSLGKRLLGARSLSLIELSGISDVGFIFLLGAVQRRDALRSIDLSSCKKITDWSLAAMATAAGNSLRSLTLDGCEGITDKGVRLIALHCRGLVELHLSRCRNVGDGGVAELFAGAAPSSLLLNSCRLQVLSLEGCGNITDESLRRLEANASNGGLAGLNLKNCSSLSTGAIAAIRDNLWWCDLIT